MPTIVGMSTEVCMLEREDIAIRLIEERARLGYSQVSFARELEISREGLRKYEMGQSSINAEILAKASIVGLDVQYVLIGVKSTYNHAVTYDERAISQPPAFKMEGNSSANVVQYAQPGSAIHLINTTKHTTKINAEVKPNDLHINEKQARKLKDLVDETVKFEMQLKKSPKSYQSVWSALNSHCGVTKYRLIPIDKYEKAEKYLRQWIGRLNRQKMAPKINNNEWRKRKYAYIKINAKGSDDWLNHYLQSKCGVTSLTELDDSALERLYSAIASKKKK